MRKIHNFTKYLLIILLFLPFACSDMMNYEPAESPLTIRISKRFAVNNNAETAYSTKVTLNSNVDGSQQMRFSNTGLAGSWSSWVSYASSYDWVIEYTSFSSCTVYAEYMDADSNVTALTDSIYFIDRIIPDTPSAGSNFGDKISISSDGLTVAVSAPDYTASKDTVFIFYRENNEWGQVFSQDMSEYVRDIAISPDGAFFAVSTSTNTDTDETVHFFKKTAGTWSSAGSINAGANLGFGYSIDFSYNSSYLAVGAYNDGPVGDKNGKVYVYETASFTLFDEILYSDDTTLDRFGQFVKFSKTDNSLIVSAPHRKYIDSYTSSTTADYGAIVICTFNGSGWTVPTDYTNTSAEIYPDNDNSALWLNHRICENGTYILFSSPQFDSGRGYAALFSNNGTTWDQAEIQPESTLLPLLTTDKFGISCAISSIDNSLFLSCMKNNGNLAEYQVSDLTSPSLFSFTELTAGDRFGYSSDISDDGKRLAVSAPGKTVNSSSKCGAVYLVHNN